MGEEEVVVEREGPGRPVEGERCESMLSMVTASYLVERIIILEGWFGDRTRHGTGGGR